MQESYKAGISYAQTCQLLVDLRCLGQIHWSDGLLHVSARVPWRDVRVCAPWEDRVVAEVARWHMSDMCQQSRTSLLTRKLEHLASNAMQGVTHGVVAGVASANVRQRSPCSIARARARASDPCVELLGRNRGGQRNVIPMIHCLASWRDVMKKEDWRLVCNGTACCRCGMKSSAFTLVGDTVAR